MLKTCDWLSGGLIRAAVEKSGGCNNGTERPGTFQLPLYYHSSVSTIPFPLLLTLPHIRQENGLPLHHAAFSTDHKVVFLQAARRVSGRNCHGMSLLLTHTHRA